MRIYTKAGDLSFSTFTFPDGQPHFKLETYEVEFSSVTIEMALKTPSDLFMVGLVVDVLRASGYSIINLDIRYLLAARMDRAIDSLQPFTLDLVSRFINSCGFSRVRILDVHSDVATRLIRNSQNVLPFSVVDQVFATLPDVRYVVSPDKGAGHRVGLLTTRHVVARQGGLIQGMKRRDPNTGAISGVEVTGCPGTSGWDCLIVDDICDGGATFVSLAKQLRICGARKIYLYVTHGVFSKELPLEAVYNVFTTDSYCDAPNIKRACYKPFETPFNRCDAAIVIPVSMKEIL